MMAAEMTVLPLVGRERELAMVAAVVTGMVVAIAALAWLMHHQRSGWRQVRAAPLFPDE